MSNLAYGAPSMVIRGARVVDGTGDASYEADVILSGQTISAIVAPGTGWACDTIDARGMVVAPGFIDAHTHDDRLVLASRVPHPKLSQGITTVVTGNCGISLAPLVTTEPPAPLDILGRSAFTFRSFQEYLEAVDDGRPAVNVVPLIGHITLRVKHVSNLERAARAHETAAMREEVRQALADGAFGLSTGVYYPPARAASTEELVAVCEALSPASAVLAMHIRDEGDEVDAALREALHVGRVTNARLVLSHHKVVGPQNHGRTRATLAMIEAAALDQQVCMDCYPYEASSTMLSPEKAARIGNVLISWSQPRPECAGHRLRALATEWGVDLEEAARRLMPGGAIYFGMSQEDVDRVVSHPLSMIGSDGLPHDDRPHPRLWGTFPRVLGHYCRERRLLSLEQAVRKMTGLTAQRFGLRDRGVIAEGKAADLVIFDPARIRDNATYEDPAAPPSGIEAVLVNGQMAVWRGEHVHAHAGRRLRPEP